ncbi:hypothetical protein, partial [Xanthomonas arboricola]|uniref:hypothetical protein n=1 Tax=Xanthomonas arboricola TaxID=56448 RepID=UPI001E29B5BE
ISGECVLALRLAGSTDADDFIGISPDLDTADRLLAYQTIGAHRMGLHRRCRRTFHPWRGSWCNPEPAGIDGGEVVNALREN